MKKLPLKVRQQVLALIEGDFLKRRDNVPVFGKPGSEKARVVSAIAREIFERNRKVRFTTTSVLVQELLVANRDLKLPMGSKDELACQAA